MPKDVNRVKHDVGNVVDTRTKYRANVEKVKSTVRSTIDTLVPGSLGYFDVLLVWQTPEVTEDESRSCRVMLVRSEQQSEPLSLPNRRAGLCLLSTVLISADAVVVPMFSGQVHARTDREIESAVLAALKEQSIGNLATVQSIINAHRGKKAKPGLQFDTDKFNEAIAAATVKGTARQDMYRAAVQAIDAIDSVLGPKRHGRLKVSYVTTTDYKNHIVLTFSWEPVEDVSDWFRVCALPMEAAKPWAAQSYPLDVVAIQNADTVVPVKNRSNCTDLVEAVINSEPFMTWLAQHTLGTA